MHGTEMGRSIYYGRPTVLLHLLTSIQFEKSRQTKTTTGNVDIMYSIVTPAELIRTTLCVSAQLELQ